MIRNLALALNIFETSRRIGKSQSQQIVGSHPLNLRRNFPASLEAQQGQRAPRIPAPARAKNRRIQRRLLQNRLYGFRLQEMKNVAQRKTMLLGQSNVQSVVGSRRLQFEIESHTKALAQS